MRACVCACACVRACVSTDACESVRNIGLVCSFMRFQLLVGNVSVRF